MNVLCQENVNVKKLAIYIVYIICILPWTVWTCPFWRNVNIFIEFWFLSFLSFVYLYLKWEWIQGNIPALNGHFKQVTRVKIRRNSGAIQRRNSSVKERRNLGVFQAELFTYSPPNSGPFTPRFLLKDARKLINLL